MASKAAGNATMKPPVWVSPEFVTATAKNAPPTRMSMVKTAHSAIRPTDR